MRTVAILLIFLLAGCAFQRAQEARDAQAQMIGMTKEQVLACMGPPTGRQAEGAIEVWSYPSGNGAEIASVIGSASGGSYYGTAVSSRRFCTVNVTMSAGRVTQLNYLGPTGGLLTQGEQCAFAIERCVKQ